MTVEQWLFEYHALRRKETAEAEVMTEAMKVGARAFRDILIGVLGLDQVVARRAGETVTRDPGAPPPFIPAAYVMGNHHLLSALMEQADKEKQAEAAMDDTAFDEFSKKLAAGEVGDLDPVLTGDVDTSYWNTLEAKEALARMVKPRAANAPAAPHFAATGAGARRGVRIVSGDDALPVVPMPGEE